MSRKNILWVGEETLLKDITGKTYIVTGANSGVGLETTRQLIKQGAHVIMASRGVEASKKVAEEFSKLKGSYEIMKLDLSDLQSVRDFVKEFLNKYDRLDGLDCNAGMVSMNTAISHTKDGFELTMGVNYFGHFLLTELLLDLLKKCAPSRIVILSSVVHAGNKKNRPNVHLDDMNYKNRKFNNFAAYSEAKVACILYARELANRLKGTGVVTASVHPGWARSNFGKGGSSFLSGVLKIVQPLTKMVSDSNWEAAQTSLHCLLSDDATKHSGSYFSQSSVLYRDKECKNGGWPMESPNPNAKDLDMAKKLVELSYRMVGIEK